MDTFDVKRAEKIKAMYSGGMVLQEIGDKFGISRERVRQILEKIGVKRTDGGFHLKCLKKEQDKKLAYLNKYLPNYGCTRKEYKQIMGDVLIKRGENCYAKRYYSQKRNAKDRGIEFLLTFPEWYKIWLDSGHIDKIGRGKTGYVMSRFADIGPYSVDNVKIISAVQNSSDTWKYKDWYSFCSRGRP